MKLTVDKKKLAEAFAAVSRFSDNRIKPILRSVHCEAAPGGLKLSANNLEAAATVNISSDEINDSGVCLLDAGKVSQFMSLAGDAKLDIETTERAVTLKCGKSKLTLPTEDPAEFPVPKFGGKMIAELPAEALAIAFRRTMLAADDEGSSRYAMTGVALDCNGSELTAVATDGRMMAVQPLGPCKGSAGIWIVPLKSVRQMIPMLTGREPVTVKGSESEFVVECGSFAVSARLLEGRFPKWQGAITAQPGSARAATSAVLGAVKSAMLVRDEESKAVTFDYEGGAVFVAGHSTAGKSEASFDLVAQGQLGRTDLDPFFVNAYLAAIGNVETVALSFGGDKAARFDADGGGFCIIMPIVKDR